MVSGRNGFAIGLGLALVMGFLAAGLHGAELRGGLPLSSAPAAIGGPAHLADPELLYLLFQIAVALAAAASVAALFLPEGRREVVGRLAIGVALAAVVLLATSLPKRLPGAPEGALAPARWSASTLGQAPPPQPAPDAGPGGGPEPPAWAASLAALAVSALVAWWGWRRAGRSPAGGPADGVAGSLAAAAAEAAARLRRGAGVAETVLQCWARMVEILSARAGLADAPALTPRELARTLAGLGFREPAIGRLTELFEEVRYGRKPDAPRREEALAALTALEQAYGRP